MSLARFAVVPAALIVAGVLLVRLGGRPMLDEIREESFGLVVFCVPEADAEPDSRARLFASTAPR